MRAAPRTDSRGGVRIPSRQRQTLITTRPAAMDLTAESFVRACREGGRRIETWLRVFDREHGAALYREAAWALRDWHVAEDVVQDALIKVWLRCATFQGPNDPLAWVRQIVRNTLLDALRSRPSEQALHDDDGELTPQAQAAVERLSLEHGTMPDLRLQDHQVERVFRDCFRRFQAAHPDHAAVLRWVVEDGLQQADVAALLDRTPGATREYISQCRKKARPFFAPWYALVSPAEPGSRP